MLHHILYSYQLVCRFNYLPISSYLICELIKYYMINLHSDINNSRPTIKLGQLEVNMQRK